MGMFDRVYIPCPKCGCEYQFQSKAGPCQLLDYRLHNANISVIENILADDTTYICVRCNASFKLIRVSSPEYATIEVEEDECK